jgi:FKBP-type peptidyl-prolyl cis-trans isomerase
MKYIKSFLIAFSALLIFAGVSAQKQQQKTVAVPQTVEKLNSSADTLQYTLGAFIGQWLVKSGFEINNTVLFNRGMDDVLQNKPLLINDTSIVKLIAAYQLSTQNERNAKQEEQLFAALKGMPGVGVLPDGVHYIVVKTGTGIRPAVTDTVVINAIGMFPDGTVFEDTYQKKQAIISVTGNLIPGLNETIQLMPEGSVWRIFVPSVLAYGTTGLSNLIPPNTALVFDISLLEVKQAKK